MAKRPRHAPMGDKVNASHIAIAKAMGFTFDRKIPPNCLHRSCFTERLLDLCDKEAAKRDWY